MEVVPPYCLWGFPSLPGRLELKWGHLCIALIVRSPRQSCCRTISNLNPCQATYITKAWLTYWFSKEDKSATPVRNYFRKGAGLTGSSTKQRTSRIAKTAVINPVWTVKRIIFAYKVSKENIGVQGRGDLPYLSYRHLQGSPTSVESGQHALMGDRHVNYCISLPDRILANPSGLRRQVRKRLATQALANGARVAAACVG